MPEKFLSLIVPVFNEQEVVGVSFERMDAVMKGMGYPYEIIYVNDGSRDDTMKQLRKIAKANPAGKGPLVLAQFRPSACGDRGNGYSQGRRAYHNRRGSAGSPRGNSRA